MSLYPLEANLLKGKKIPNNKIYLVPNGVDGFYEERPSNKEINCVIEKYKIDRSYPILFFTGNHTANKGLDIIREIYKNLNIKSTIVIGGRLSNKNEPKLFSKGIDRKMYESFLRISYQLSIKECFITYQRFFYFQVDRIHYP